MVANQQTIDTQFPPVAAVRDWIRKMLSAVQFHGHACTRAPQINFQRTHPIERNRQPNVDAESAFGLRQCLQPTTQEHFRRAPGPVGEISARRDVERKPGMTFVANGRSNAEVAQRLLSVFEATSRHADVM